MKRRAYYMISALLFLVWAIVFFTFHPGATVHLLPFIAVILYFQAVITCPRAETSRKTVSDCSSEIV